MDKLAIPYLAFFGILALLAGLEWLTVRHDPEYRAAAMRGDWLGR